MKSLIALVLLGQILASKATSEPFPPLIGRRPDCDDPEIENAAKIAMDHINSHTLHGYKHVFNRMENVKVLPRRPTGEIIFLEMDTLETNCHVMSPTPVENCTVRARTEHAVEGDCDVKMLLLEGQYKVLSTKCHSSPDSREDLQRLCPDCAPLQPLNEPEVMNAVTTALAEFNAHNETDHHYDLLEITRGRHSHMPRATFVEFAIAATNCTEKEANEHKDCHVMTGEHAHFGFCKATVFKKPSGDGPTILMVFPDNVVACEIFDKKVGHSHTHLTQHHLGKKIPSPGVGHTVLDLIHSHNNTLASHESHSAEVPAVQASPVVKRAAVDVAQIQPMLHLQQCPGKYRHFAI
ncbi:alpha-2-HS-glycoprotein [Anolis sagrei]|uniref:alpha-2-HS-glycoprotein n=1 Tax=Anolis sagrei TaxID=38937 RepID=UPI003520ED85